MKLNGFIESYEWAKTADECFAHLLLRGPCILGTTWTIDMFTPDRWNTIRPTGRSVGGHAYMLRGCNTERVDPLTRQKGMAKKRGSWGLGWAERGEAWLTKADLQRLIDDWGEAALPIEKKKAA